ncbi:GNAT family N-acetyltransferase [Streptomyces sp. NPDC126497]|uniref:GNAT family N-acetyltransferase n=1 Tax=Streptomyces sp. NPDC126497 TaxID=3155313 RepID=UPI003316F66C
MSVEWAALPAEDLQAVVGLSRRCLAVDRGLSVTASRGFLEKRYTGEGVSAVGGFYDDTLIAAGSVRDVRGFTVVTGQVDPAHRRRGLGSALLDQLLETARRRPGALRVETESLTADADDLFRSRGLRQAFAEDVMHRGLEDPLPEVLLPAGVETEEWGDANQGDFFDAYRSSFADRPGFPGWTREQWTDWTAGDDFRPQYSLLARSSAGAPVGFVTCAQDFLIQVGVAPRGRRRGLGRSLAVAALTRMRSGGGTDVFLDVNVNNPASAALFRSLGFTSTARRARYESSRYSTPASRSCCGPG